MTDVDWDNVVRAYRKKKGFAPLTPEEADAAYDAAPPVPLAPGRIEEIVKAVTSRDTAAGDGPEVRR